MTQYDDQVEYQRNLLKAEEWAKIPKSVQIHNLDSMWYETEESKKFLKKGKDYQMWVMTCDQSKAIRNKEELEEKQAAVEEKY